MQLQDIKRSGFGNLKTMNEFNFTLTHWRRIFDKNMDKRGTITDNGTLSQLKKREMGQEVHFKRFFFPFLKCVHFKRFFFPLHMKCFNIMSCSQKQWQKKTVNLCRIFSPISLL